jgi:hypothetical protein
MSVRLFVQIQISFNALTLEEVRTSETSIHFKVTTQGYIPEDSKLHTYIQFSVPEDKYDLQWAKNLTFTITHV